MKEDHLHAMRHSAAHVLAAAVQKLYPNVKLGVGPVIENGFFYDVVVPDHQLTEGDLKNIQKEMQGIINRGAEFRREEMSLEKAIGFFGEKDQDFKVELLKDLKERGTTKISDEELQDVGGSVDTASVYYTGDFVDLCRGPHVENSKEIGAIKLTKIAGAYWRGNSENEQMQRIYGLAFETKEDLNEHLKILEEAKKRDHRKIGQELDLFTFSELVGPGLILWTPKGTVLRNLLDGLVWKLRKEKGYDRVEIPHITKKELYEKSGHWEKFSNELFRITTREGHEFAMKPMNCPHHTQIFDRKLFSYRDMPQRYANTTMCYRDEQTGELHGLSRVRGFTQDDAHVFCRFTQVKEEMMKIWDIIETFYQAVGFGDLEVHLSLHNPEEPEKYLGSPDVWKNAEAQLRSIVENRGTTAIEDIGEAAFYGPKIDFIAKDAIGREWQVATIQLDMNMPERFDLTCIDEEGNKERVVMVHAAVMGSLERFLSILIEHHVGAFPLWLSPVQVVLASVGEKHIDYVKDVEKQLLAAGIRVEANVSSDTIGSKV
ncbi:MAG: threonine--tRNA ligase, partial [bacterium]|nr:threonine--tRNA ligase [bacterium]